MRVNSIFETISGEAGGFPQGTWITGIRLQGCNLASKDGDGGCVWCDTPQSRSHVGGQEMTISEVVDAVGSNRHILITGGEPLWQKEDVVVLIRRLISLGHKVQVETNGSLRIPSILDGQSQLHWVIDYKCPSSGVVEMPTICELGTWLRGIEKDGGTASVKWVVADDADLDFAIEKMQRLLCLGACGAFIISLLDGEGSRIPGMARRIRQRDDIERLLDHIIFSVQLHKIFKLP